MNAFMGEINDALSLWNSVPNSRINFTLTSGSTHDILIMNADLGTNRYGSAYFPINGRPGQIVFINLNEISGWPSLHIRKVIAHELGHTIGFRHTDWFRAPNPESLSGVLPDNGARYSAMHILGTPIGTDPNSLMNRGTVPGAIGPTSLSSYDILALQFLYPANPPVTGTVPIFRYYLSSGGNYNHFFTRNFDAIGNGNVNGYNFEGIGFFAYPTQYPGTVPIYRFYNHTYSNHYYATESTTPPGFVFEAIEFYAYPTNLNGSVPIYRFYNHLPIVDHHYTKNPNESPMSGYVNEGIVFYAY